MKPISPQLVALLATKEFLQFDCYTFVLFDGHTERYCAGDQSITLNGLLYSCGGAVGPFFDRKDNRAKIQERMGTGADQMTVDVTPGGATIEGADWFTAAREGTFDAADVTLETVYMPFGTLDTSRGSLVRFVGRVAEVDAGGLVITFSINSHAELLNMQLPHNIYQPPCVNNLGDNSCGVNPIPSATGVFSAGSDTHTLYGTISGGPYATGAFDQGKILVTSGPANGALRGVQVVNFGSPSQIILKSPLPIGPAIANTFQIFYGCDKSLGPNGCPKFNNQARFRGFRFVPQPVQAV